MSAQVIEDAEHLASLTSRSMRSIRNQSFMVPAKMRSSPCPEARLALP